MWTPRLGDSFRHFVWELMLGTGLHRLPEVLAVINGDISLVGPEPRPYDEPATRFPKWAKAGLTGLSQVSGFSWNDGRRVIVIDRYYLTGASLRLDLAVLVRSLALILSGAR